MLSPRRFDSLLNIRRPPLLIDPILPVGSLTVLTAPSFAGKTFFAVEAARAIVSGTPFMGRFPTRAGTAMLVEEDAPLYDVGNVIKDVFWQDWLKFSVLGPANPMLDFFHMIHQGASLNSKESTAALSRAIRSIETPPTPRVFVDPDTGEVSEVEGLGGGVDLLILDTMRSLHSGDEDNSTEMQVVMTNIRTIQRETGVTVLLLHHHNKNDKYRGSTVIKDAADGLIELSPSKEKGGPVKVSNSKGRAVAWDSFSYRISRRDDQTKEVRVVELKEEVEKVTDFKNDRVYTLVSTLVQSEPREFGDLLRLVAMSYETPKSTEAVRSVVRRRIKDLVEKGVVVKNGTHYSWKGLDR